MQAEHATTIPHWAGAAPGLSLPLHHQMSTSRRPDMADMGSLMTGTAWCHHRSHSSAASATLHTCIVCIVICYSLLLIPCKPLSTPPLRLNPNPHSQFQSHQQHME